ncbi:hypothetical protein LSM04_009342 [Trypanosoma melophagium]|uniref:uncharacterized protein n=1 Tax=Trypanosoma melophagium TaxID=715481 RepID=UPI00351A7105|nr:hypothetical protein LSM04_009342 [Trypanosoma melophagium]
MNDPDLDTDDLVARAVDSAVYRQQRGRRCNRVQDRVALTDHPVRGDDKDLFRDSRTISLNQLLQEEPLLPLKGEFTPLSTTNMPSLDNDDEELTALQRLVVTHHTSHTSNRDATNDSSRCHLSLPPRTELNSSNTGFKESVSHYQEDTKMNDPDRLSRRKAQSIEQQYDTSNTKRSVESQEQQQKPFPKDLEASVLLLARIIRKLEMHRFGHSAAFFFQIAGASLDWGKEKEEKHKKHKRRRAQSVSNSLCIFMQIYLF